MHLARHHILKEKSRNLQVMGFVGKQVTSVLEKRPKRSEAGLEGID